MKGLVVKKIADKFDVKLGEEISVCVPRGNLKAKGIFVGDYVNVEDGIIEEVCERKNILVRPPIANLDQLIIVVSAVPKPDFFIVDKLILFAYCYGIEPIIVVNKQDLSSEQNEYIKNTYESFIKVVFVSAKSGENIDEFKKILSGKLSAFAGQSAVGKSALINKIISDYIAEEGELSTKIDRGKNTTRHSQIYFESDIMITDTSGFTSLDETLLPLAYYELPYYYKDYNIHKNECKYTSCMHVGEPLEDCRIKQLVKEGKLDRERYLRYRTMYQILEQKWVKTHG